MSCILLAVINCAVPLSALNLTRLRAKMSLEEGILPDKAKTAVVAADESDHTAVSNLGSVVDDALGKHTRKLTAKGFTMLFKNLQKNRNSQFAQVNNMKQRINKLLSGTITSQIVSDVKEHLSQYSTLCKETLETQTT